jgi:hypothetical protein
VSGFFEGADVYIARGFVPADQIAFGCQQVHTWPKLSEPEKAAVDPQVAEQAAVAFTGA